MDYDVDKESTKFAIKDKTEEGEGSDEELA